MVADAADDLAVAADAVLAAARNCDVEEATLLALRTALDRYRAAGAV
jgi:hypothetical protein